MWHTLEQAVRPCPIGQRCYSGHDWRGKNQVNVIGTAWWSWGLLHGMAPGLSGWIAASAFMRRHAAVMVVNSWVSKIILRDLCRTRYSLCYPSCLFLYIPVCWNAPNDKKQGFARSGFVAVPLLFTASHKSGSKTPKIIRQRTPFPKAHQKSTTI